MMLPLVTTSIANDALLRTIHAQPSYVIATHEVELAVTRLGGHMAPVTFFRDTDVPVRPYHITPWQDEQGTGETAPVVIPLRGDFFCLPFGGNAEAVAGEKHPPHGEIAGEPWTLVGSKTEGGVTTLTMSFETKVRKGRVTKELSLVEGQNVIYSRNIIEGFVGRVPLGHHATLAMPEEEGAVRIATSAFRFGMTNAGLFSEPTKGEYQWLQPGKKWTDLSKVPVAWKGEPDADLTRLPAKTGFADLVQIWNESWETSAGPAWITATFAKQGYLWFALKDPAVLRSTVFWLEHRGRHGYPWNGRNNCLGLEDVTACFADGLGPSIHENALTKEGVDTALELHADRPTAVNYIQGVVKIPADFETVKTLKFTPGQVTFISPANQQVSAAVHHEFIRTGKW